MKKTQKPLKALHLVGVLLLSSCATQPQYSWQVPVGSDISISKVEARCDYETSAATQGTDYSLRTSFGQELDRAMRKQSLFEKCMFANGMRKVYANTPDAKPKEAKSTNLESDWEASGLRRQSLFKQLQANPNAPNAAEIRAEIQSLNVKIRDLEKKLSYAPSQPLAVE